MDLPLTRRIGRDLDDPAIGNADPDVGCPAIGKQRGFGVKDHGDSLDLHYV